MAEASDYPVDMHSFDVSDALVDSSSGVYPRSQDFNTNSGFEPMDASVYPVETSADERDITKMSDHITVWVDAYLGDPEHYKQFREKFENLQVLNSSVAEQNEVDDEQMAIAVANADPDMLKKLREQVYCLKYFCQIPEAVQFIQQNSDKRIFFISSGSIGKDIVPQIAELPQIQGIYIFCGNISAHVGWAAEYIDYISAMLEHQDNLLTRLSRDIAEYLEKKGDRYKQNEAPIPARNCYAWAKKLLLRAKTLGDNSVSRLITKLDDKIAVVLAGTQCA